MTLRRSRNVQSALDSEVFPLEARHVQEVSALSESLGILESHAAGRDFLVEAIDGSASAKSEDQALADAPGNLAAAVKGTLGPMTYAATGKVTGREFTLARPGRPTAKVRVFVENKHLYEAIAESSLGPDEPEVTTFLDSFRLLDQPAA